MKYSVAYPESVALENVSDTHVTVFSREIMLIIEAHALLQARSLSIPSNNFGRLTGTALSSIIPLGTDRKTRFVSHLSPLFWYCLPIEVDEGKYPQAAYRAGVAERYTRLSQKQVPVRG